MNSTKEILKMPKASTALHLSAITEAGSGVIGNEITELLKV
jgi:hypothetical protein